MNNNLILLILLFLASCVNENKSIITDEYQNGVIKTIKEFPNPNDTINYKLIHFESNGDTTSILNYRGNRFNGEIKEFKNGKLRSICKADMGYFIDRKVIYNESGIVIQIDSIDGKCALDNCCCTGVITRYYNDGTIKESLPKNDFGFHGTLSTYNKNGTLKRLMNYHNDTLNGDYYAYDSAGVITHSYIYLNGLKNGLTTEYHKNGIIVKGNYLNGEETGTWVHLNQKGDTINSSEYVNGNKILHTTIAKK